MMMRHRVAGMAVLGLTIVALAAPVRSADAVTVFAAASLGGLMEDIGEAQAVGDGVALRLVYGGSGQLARQIVAGAEADAFISADPDWTHYLVEDGSVTAGLPATLFSNSLVLVAPRGSAAAISLKPGVDLAAVLGDGRLAMGAPDHVPAGEYGRSALEWLGAWDQLAGRAAFADNVRQALAWVARGEAPLGIVYGSDAVAEPNVRIVAVFPDASHGPIAYTGVAINGGDVKTAERLFAFMGSASARAILERHGFIPLVDRLRPPS